MARYARKLSLVGFALAAWYVYVLVWSLWQSWDFERRHGFGDFPSLEAIAFGLVAITLPLGAAVLLRRLAAPGPASFSVRWQARLWFVLALCGAGWASFGLWSISSSSNFYAYLASFLHIASLALILVNVVYFLAIMPPLWSLPRRPR